MKKKKKQESMNNMNRSQKIQEKKKNPKNLFSFLAVTFQEQDNQEKVDQDANLLSYNAI